MSLSRTAAAGRFAPRLRIYDNTQTLIGEATTNNIPNASTPVAVTYTFPTLNPMSVQVRKSLVNDDE